MGYGTTPVKADRIKLIDRLKERVKEHEDKLAENFLLTVKEQITATETKLLDLKVSLNHNTERLTILKKVKKVSDLADLAKESCFRVYTSENELNRMIRTLELSSEDSIVVKADSDLYRYL